MAVGIHGIACARGHGYVDTKIVIHKMINVIINAVTNKDLGNRGVPDVRIVHLFAVGDDPVAAVDP